MISACVRVDGLLGFFENFLRLIANHSVGDFNIHRFNRSRARARLGFVAAERTVLEGREPRSIAGEAHVCREFALEHLAGEDQLAAFILESDAIADDCASHRSRQLGNEVAHLIGMRHQDQLRLLGCQELLQRRGEGVRRVRLEFRRLDRINFRDFLRGNFGRDALRHRRRQRLRAPIRLLRQWPVRRQWFPRKRDSVCLRAVRRLPRSYPP